MIEEQFEELLQKLQCQFLCCFPLNSIDWQKIVNRNLTWEEQQQLIDRTAGHKLNLRNPVKIGYQLNFLKRLIELLEKNCEEVHDCVYEFYCQVQQRVAPDVAQKYAYKHYLLPAYDTHFTLRESKSFVAEATTGLCSWQASLALADYLLHNSKIVSGKSVLELGAGTGLCGFILTRCCKANKVLLTDGSAECVEQMRENILRNFSNASEHPRDTFEVDQQILATCQLSWDAIEMAHLEDKIKPNVILAADVVYDDSVFKDLAHSIDFSFNLMENQTKMLLAATVRNEHTLKKFLELLESLMFCIEEQTVIPLERSNLYWDRSTPVKILLITRNQSI